MAVYQYDGNFETLVSLCYALAARNEVPDDICIEGSGEPGLFSEMISVKEGSFGFTEMIDTLQADSPRAMSYLCGAFMSELPGAEIACWKFMDAVSEMGFSIIDNLADNRVMEIFKIQKKVYLERHRMLGFLRFSELSDGSWYAPFEPDHNIISIVAPHFSKRLAGQNWILHDIKRGLGVMYTKESGRWHCFDMEQSSPIRYSENEMAYRALWKMYCKEIAIPERKNPACQKRFMPVRYWKYLTERV